VLSKSAVAVTVAQWQTVLRSITFSSTSDDPDASPRTVSFKINDGDSDSPVVSRQVTVTPVNDAPVIALRNVGAAPLVYVENGGAIAVSSTIAVSDPDWVVNADSSATIVLSSPDLTNEFLLWNASSESGVSMQSYNTSSGVLTLVGQAPVLQWQAALRGVMFTCASEDPRAGERTISITLHDGLARSNSTIRAVSVMPVNDVPVLAGLEQHAVLFTKLDTARVVSDSIQVVDMDVTSDSKLDGARVMLTQITSAGSYHPSSGDDNYHPSSGSATGSTTAYAAGWTTPDSLSFVAQSGIVGTYSAETHVLELTGAATQADYQTALRSVQFSSNLANFTGATERAVTFSIFDGSAWSELRSRVVTLSAAPVAPMVDSVSFSATGTSVVLKFNVPTDRGSARASCAGYSSVAACAQLLGASQFDCSEFLAFPAGRIYSPARCTWQGSSEMSVVLPSYSTVVPGDVIGLHVAVVKQTCTNVVDGCTLWPFNAVQNATIAASSLAEKPGVVLSGPSQLGSCDGIITLSSGMSSGGGGRPFTAVVWNVSSSIGAADAANITAALSAVATEQVFDSSLLTPGAVYTFGLQLTNFLGASDSAVHAITRRAVPLPALTIPGNPKRTLLRSESLALFAKGKIPACASNSSLQSPNRLVYSWAVSGGVSGGVALPLMTITSVLNLARDPRWLRLGTDFVRTYLSAGGLYTFTAAVSDSTGATNTATAAVQVASSPLRAVIIGGSRAVGGSDDFVVDGSQSADPDASPTSADGGVAFSWACSPMLTGLSDCSLPASTALNSSALFVPAGTLQADRKYRFVLTVTADERLASTQIDVEVKSTTPPAVSITTSSFGKINADAKLTLEADVYSLAESTAVWSQTTGDLPWASGNDTSIFATPTSVTAIAAALTVVPLVIYANSLTAGSSYTFQLTATDSASNIGFSTFSVAVNTPPRAGLLTVSPRAGVVLTDTFAMSSNSWVDDAADLPFKYRFAYSAGVTTAASPELLLTGTEQDSNQYTALLPEGSGINSTITCIGYVLDKYGAAARATSEVSVAAASLEVAELATAAGSLLASATATASSEAVFEAIGAVGGALNKGMSDSSNEDDEAIVPTAVDEAGAGCSSGSDCLSSRCKDGICALALLFCPVGMNGTTSLGECSSHGICRYVDNDGELLPSTVDCVAGIACTAECVCSSNWYGSDCSMGQAEYEARQALRATLLSALVNASAKMQSDPTALAQQSSFLNLITSEPKQLNSEAQLSALDFVGTIANASNSAVEPILKSTADSCGGSLSSLLDSSMLEDQKAAVAVVTASGANATMRRRLLAAVQASSSRVDAKMKNALDSLSNAQLNGAVVGEAAATMSTKNIKMASQRNTPSAFTRGIALAPPQAAEDAAAGGTSPSFSLGAGVDLGNGTGVDAQVLRFAKNVFKAESNESVGSDVVSLSFSSGGKEIKVNASSNSTAATSGKSPGITLVLPTKFKTDYSAQSSSIVLKYTCERGVDYNVSKVIGACPLTGNVTVACDVPWWSNTSVANRSVVCETKAQPTCRFWDAELKAWSGQGCVLKSFTPFNTTCECTHLTSFASTAGVIGDEFSAVLGSADKLFDPSYLARNLVIVGTFGGMFVVFVSALIWGWQKDKNEKKNHDQNENVRKQKAALHDVMKRGSGVNVAAAKMLGNRNASIQARRESEQEEQSKKNPKFHSAAYNGLMTSLGPLISGTETMTEWLPAAYRPRKLMTQFCEAVKTEHKWFSVVWLSDRYFTRPRRVIFLYSSVMAVFFTNALLYNYKNSGSSDPNYDPCGVHSSDFSTARAIANNASMSGAEKLTAVAHLRGDEAKCLAETDLIGAGVCDWDSSDQECFVKPVGFDVWTTIALAIISGLVAAPPNAIIAKFFKRKHESAEQVLSEVVEIGQKATQDMVIGSVKEPLCRKLKRWVKEFQSCEFLSCVQIRQLSCFPGGGQKNTTFQGVMAEGILKAAEEADERNAEFRGALESKIVVLRQTMLDPSEEQLRELEESADANAVELKRLEADYEVVRRKIVQGTGCLWRLRTMCCRTTARTVALAKYKKQLGMEDILEKELVAHNETTQAARLQELRWSASLNTQQTLLWKLNQLNTSPPPPLPGRLCEALIWLFALAYVAFIGLYVVLFGLSKGSDVGWAWLSAIFITFLEEIFISGTLQVLMIRTIIPRWLAPVVVKLQSDDPHIPTDGKLRVRIVGAFQGEEKRDLELREVAAQQIYASGQFPNVSGEELALSFGLSAKRWKNLNQRDSVPNITTSPSKYALPRLLQPSILSEAAFESANSDNDAGDIQGDSEDAASTTADNDDEMEAATAFMLCIIDDV
jgi:hypothetical protein